MIHALVTMWSLEEANRRATPRICPKCGSKQSVIPKKINKPISCKKCGAQIPPRKADRK